MNGKLVARATKTLTVPFSENSNIPQSQITVIKFGTNKTIDFGILCYKNRSRSANPIEYKRSQTRKVDLSSIDELRVVEVANLLAHISEVARYGSLAQATLHDRFSRMVVFINWADANNWPDVLCHEANAYPALVAYLEEVKQRVDKNKIANNAGAKQQECVVTAFSEYHNTDYKRRLNLLRRDRQTGEVTSPPDEKSQTRALVLAGIFFNAGYAVTVGKSDFPYRIEMPSYLEYPENSLWVMPSITLYKTVTELKENPISYGFNYLDGTVISDAEIQEKYKECYRNEKKLAIKKNIDDSSKDYWHRCRMRLASEGANGYIVQFMAATGMNWTQLIDLTWDEDYETTTSNQGFRTIKWRANGKIVSFELPISAMPDFKRYLALRSHILNGEKIDRLFFIWSKSGEIRPIIYGLNGFFERMTKIDSEFQSITSRKWRAAKSDWLIRNTDPAVAALVLQNTERTVIQHYAKGSESAHHEEMGSFLSAVAEKVLVPVAASNVHTPISIGHCKEIDNPLPISTSKRAPKECLGNEGCFYCSHFRIHADEEDIRKILSCRYVLLYLKARLITEESVPAEMTGLLSRINDVIHEISAGAGELVSRVSEEVDAGELSRYWSLKFAMLLELES